MFNSNNGYSLSDIAAATGGNNGNRNCDDMWGGNGAWWIIILFLFCFAGREADASKQDYCISK